jgi:hypothetical protein
MIVPMVGSTMRAMYLAMLVLAGCLKAEAITCGTVTCPSDSTCGPANECVPEGCGNGIVSGLETCDGDLGSLTCADFGYTAGALSCSAVCQIDTSRCLDACGNHVVDTAELCDGIPPAGFSCADFGYDVGPLLCSSACSPSFALCGSIGWKTSPGGGTNELRGIVATDANAGLAVGLGGLILRSTDGVWSPMQSPTTKDLFGIAGSGTNAVAVGADGTLLTFDGTTWAQVQPQLVPDKDLYAVAATSATTAVAVGEDGVILDFSADTWTVTVPAGSGLDLFGVWGSGPAAIAVGEAGTVLRRLTGTWSAVTGTGASTASTVHLRTVFGVDGEIFIGGDNTQLLRFTGSSWQTIAIASPTVPPTIGVYALWATTKNDVFIGLQGGSILHWNGTAIAQHTSPTTRSIFSLSGVNPARVFGATRGGQVIDYNGTDRRIEFPPTSVMKPTLTSIYKTNATDYITSGSGDVLEYDGTWSTWVVPTTPFLNTVWSNGLDVWVGAINELFYRDRSASQFSSLNTGHGANALDGVIQPLYVIAVGDKVYESTNGSTFIEDTAGPNAGNTLHDVWHSADGVWFAVGDNGFAMRRAGTSGLWTMLATNTTEVLSKIWGTAANDVFVVGSHGLILHYDGTAWRRMFTGSGENLTSVHGNSHDDVYVSGTNGLLLHFGGTSWTRMTTPLDVQDLWADGEDTLFIGNRGLVEWIERLLLPKETRCSDPWDDDLDGAANCDDPDCSMDPNCLRGGTCATFTRVDCGVTQYTADTYTGITRIDDLPCLDHSTPGPEASLRIVADHSGPITVTMTNPGGHLDLVVAPAMLGACELGACTAATATAGTKSVTFDAIVGRSYYVIVDGPVYVAEDFTLDVSCP